MMNMSMRKGKHVRNLIKTSTLLAGIVLLVGCDRNEPGSGEGRTSVTVQLNWVPEPEFGGIYQAQIDGIFKDEGLNVVIRPGSAGVSAPQLADTGDVEFALVGGSQILLLNAQGGELIALFAIFQDDPHAIMVPVDSPFKSLRALWSDPDAVIGAEGDLAFIRAINLKFGVPNGARHVAYNLPAFRAGRQQASQCFMMAEPVSLELAGFKTRVFMANESGFNEYNTVLVTRRSFLASNRATCVAMVRSFSKGWSAYLASPERANKVMAGLNPAMSDEIDGAVGEASGSAHPGFGDRAVRSRIHDQGTVAVAWRATRRLETA